MSVYIQTAMETKGVGRQNPGHGLNLRRGAGLDSFMFDSMISNFMTRETDRFRGQAAGKPERMEDRQYSRKTAEPAGTRRDPEIDGPGKIDAGSQKPARTSGAGEQCRGNEYDDINGQPAQAGKYAEEDGKAVNQSPGAAKRDSASPGNNHGAAKDDPDDLETAGLLLRRAGLSYGAAGATAGKGSSQQAGDAGAAAENAPKILSQDGSDGGKKSVNRENVQPADTKNPLKSGAPPEGVLKNTGSGHADGQGALTAGGKDPQSPAGDLARTDNGLKACPPFREKIIGLTGEKGINNIEEMIRKHIRTAVSADPRAGEGDLFTLSGRSAHPAGQFFMRQFQLQEAVTATAGGNGARILPGVRLTSGLAGNLNREGGSGSQPKTARTAPGHGNTDTAGSGVIAQAGGKGRNIQHAARAAAPPAFNDAVDRIVYIARGGNRLGVTVENETVGKLNISVSLNKGMVNVHINAADNATREFVQNNIQHIVDSLAKSGVSVGGFSVGLRNHRDGESGENRYAYGNGNTFDIDGGRESAYPAEKAGRGGSGMISVFA